LEKRSIFRQVLNNSDQLIISFSSYRLLDGIGKLVTPDGALAYKAYATNTSERRAILLITYPNYF
jgi:hypothetical protein